MNYKKCPNYWYMTMATISTVPSSLSSGYSVLVPDVEALIAELEKVSIQTASLYSSSPQELQKRTLQILEILSDFGAFKDDRLPNQKHPAFVLLCMLLFAENEGHASNAVVEFKQLLMSHHKLDFSIKLNNDSSSTYQAIYTFSDVENKKSHTIILSEFPWGTNDSDIAPSDKFEAEVSYPHPQVQYYRSMVNHYETTCETASKLMAHYNPPIEPQIGQKVVSDDHVSVGIESVKPEPARTKPSPNQLKLIFSSPEYETLKTYTYHTWTTFFLTLIGHQGDQAFRGWIMINSKLDDLRQAIKKDNIELCIKRLKHIQSLPRLPLPKENEKGSSGRNKTPKIDMKFKAREKEAAKYEQTYYRTQNSQYNAVLERLQKEAASYEHAIKHLQ